MIRLQMICVAALLALLCSCTPNVSSPPPAGNSQAGNSQPGNSQTVTSQSGDSKGALTLSAVTASKSLGADNQPGKAADRNLETIWNSGEIGPHWIQVDLGQPTSISKVRLNVSQEPAGRTVHEISGGESPDKLSPLGTLDGVTKDGQWLELPVNAASVRYVKINTKVSSGWVSWREIEVFK